MHGPFSQNKLQAPIDAHCPFAQTLLASLLKEKLRFVVVTLQMSAYHTYHKAVLIQIKTTAVEHLIFAENRQQPPPTS
jgi:hypothetical protein